MLDALDKAFKLRINEDIYTAFTSAFDSLPSAFTVSGSFSEDELITLIRRRGCYGKQALIAGTLKALRKVNTAIVSDSAKEDVYKMGHYGSFNGVPMMRIRQVHSVGTYTFKLSENDIYVVTTDEKPVKFVTEGESRVLSGDAMANADLTQEYFFANQYGTGIVITDLLVNMKFLRNNINIVGRVNASSLILS